MESSIIQRRAQRPRRDIDLDMFSQVRSEIDKRSIFISKDKSDFCINTTQNQILPNRHQVQYMDDIAS